ncbi:MAG: transcriptional repressor [Flavobacteriaceae bacterium]|nr:transcriptional repressor [Flavobacteriaceae bacterium]MCY4216262.1 transcriptional repressor [Flavobacteriaceae bacterium]MCY4253123.1 transcriptional repressor [Flavobacteriaceae bacterium]
MVTIKENVRSDRDFISKNQQIVKEVFVDYLKEKKLRRTPERFNVLNEIYSLDSHFEVERLHKILDSKSYNISVATVYNTIDLLLECGLIRRHQFGSNQNYYEKSYFNKQHDHVILTDSGEIKEFCDPRIGQIKKTIEKVFDIDIHDHTLYFYGTKKKS